MRINWKTREWRVAVVVVVVLTRTCECIVAWLLAEQGSLWPECVRVCGHVLCEGQEVGHECGEVVCCAIRIRLAACATVFECNDLE